MEEQGVDRGRPAGGRRKWPVVAAVSALVVLGLAAFLVLRPKGVTIHGTIVQNGTCYQLQHNAMASGGARVEILDGADAVIGVTEAGSQKIASTSLPPIQIQGGPFPVCTSRLSYSVRVAKGTVYAVSVNGSALPVESYEVLAAKGFEVDVKLNDLPH